MVTISDIARELGLSTATVSNALSGKGRVSDVKRKQIIEAATRLGYDFKRIRVAQPRRNIAVIVETLSVIFCTKIAEGLWRAAEAGGYQVKVLEDDWTTVTLDGSLSAHFEHTVAITPNGPVIMTVPDI